MKPVDMRWAVALVALISVAVPASVRAQNDAPGEIGFLVGVSRGDADLIGGNQGASYSAVYGLRAAARCNTPLSLFYEGLYGQYDTSIFGEQSKVLEGRAGFERIFRTSEPGLAWFLSGGLGYADVNYPAGLADFGRPFVSGGIGLRIDSGKSSRFRIELRGEQWIGDDGVFGAGIANGQLLFGWSLGLHDRAVDIDSDRDGVYDRDDACPKTPLGARVDAKGCPLDSDGDGVYDGIDKCPGTPRGTPVDASGCPKKAKPLFEEGKNKLILEGVNFVTASAELTPESRGILDRVAESLRDWPEVKVEVGGHTDWIGASAYNLDLSSRRADTVRSYLVGKGVAASRLVAKGYGESQPIASNATPEGRAKNRRVELTRLER